MPFYLRHRYTIAVAAVLAAASLPYLPTLHDYFMQDDFGVVWLLSKKPPFHFPHWFTGPWTEDIWGYVPDEVRPFPALSYQIAWYLGAGSPVANHVMNIAFHAANAWLVMWIATAAAGLSLPAAAFAGVVFGVLPIEAESVAWVTGRVDSLPAFFYLGSFALFVRWRANAGRATYAWSAVFFFMALFSKQNTITLAPALVLFDFIVGRVPLRVSWKWLRPYLPYVVLTIGFLLLRYILFREFAREGFLTSQRLQEFVGDVWRHLIRLVYGDAYMTMPRVQAVVVLGVIVLAAAFLDARRRVGAGWRMARPAIYFGVAWIVLGIAPALVAGYYSPRHAYLASVGWAVVAGVIFNVLWLSAPSRLIRPLASAAAVALVVFYSLQLRNVVRDWNQRAAVSQQAVRDLEREAAGTPQGTLMIVGVPGPSWAFSVPYSARPPFTSTDLTEHVRLISDSTSHCCPVHLWEEYTRRTIQEWVDNPARPPVMALNWSGRTKALSLVTENDRPDLRPLVTVLLRSGDRTSLDRAIRSLLGEVALTAPVPHPQ